MTLIEDTRRTANPVENGNLDAFINQWGFPLFIEIKRDGERCWIYKNTFIGGGESIIAFNKHNTIYNEDTHKDLFDQWRNIGEEFLIEGELCAKEGQLYSYLSNRNNGKDLVFYPFDILKFKDDKREFPFLNTESLQYRKAVMNHVKIPDGVYDVAKSRADLTAAFDYITKEQGQEGIVIKSPKQRYCEGYWLKMKRLHTIDAVITGIRKKEHYLLDNLARSYRLGLNDRLDGTNPPQNGQFIPNYSNYKWIGDCGSGLAIYEKEVLTQLLESSAIFEDKDYIATSPTFVVEVVCDSRSKDNRLVHPRIKRIRTDQPPEKCLLSQLGNLPIRD